jgi:hypothetical protein
MRRPLSGRRMKSWEMAQNNPPAPEGRRNGAILEFCNLSFHADTLAPDYLNNIRELSQHGLRIRASKHEAFLKKSN